MTNELEPSAVDAHKRAGRADTQKVREPAVVDLHKRAASVTERRPLDERTRQDLHKRTRRVR